MNHDKECNKCGRTSNVVNISQECPFCESPVICKCGGEDLCSKCKIGLHLGDPCECGCHKKPVEEECCDLCFDEGVSQLSYGGCSNSKCPCHSPKLGKSNLLQFNEKTKEWEKKEECPCNPPHPWYSSCTKVMIKPVEEKCCGKLLTPHGQEFTCGQTLPCIWHSKPDKTESKYDVSIEIIPLKTQEESWEEKLQLIYCEKCGEFINENIKQILKDYVNSLLSSERSRLLKELEEDLEGMEITMKFKPVTERYKGAEDRKYGYNNAIADFIKLIQEKGNEL